MATNWYDVNHQLESDSLLPPRKRLLAGFKKQNSRIIIGINESPASLSSTTTTTTSNGSSSASTDVQTHLDNIIMTSQLNDKTRSQEEIARTSKATAALAVKFAKEARAAANEKAMIASKALAAAKSALELFASFPVEAAVSCKERSPRKNTQKKKHVPVQLLYSKGGRGGAVAADEDLARRLNRAIISSPRVLKDCSSGHTNKKRKSVVTYENSTVTSTMYDGNDVAGVVDAESSTDEEVDRRTRVNGKLLLCHDNALKEKTGQESSSSSLVKTRGRVKLKKLPLSMCASKDQENVITSSNDGVAQVKAGPSWK